MLDAFTRLVYPAKREFRTSFPSTHDSRPNFPVQIGKDERESWTRKLRREIRLLPEYASDEFLVQYEFIVSYVNSSISNEVQFRSCLKKLTRATMFFSQTDLKTMCHAVVR